jgi:phospholipid/cholesterol/gamma-HCH transport system substrate-binding protein
VLAGGKVPSEKELRWSQLRVGLTVLFASITLGVLVFLMTGTTGLFSKKITIYSYVDNAGGLRNGAPVRLQGVDIGNVTGIRVVPEKSPNPVEIRMKLSNRYQNFLREDSAVQLSTAGVLGETFVDIDSRTATGPYVHDGVTLKAQAVPDLQDVVRSSQTTLQNVDVLLKRADRIMGAVESGQGSVGKLIYDKQLYVNLNSAIQQVQGILNDVNNGRGSIGKLLKDDDMYNKLNTSIDKLNGLVEGVNSGQGTLGKLVKDPALYNNANQTLAKANELMTNINQGKGALGKFTHDEEFAKKLETTVTNLNSILARLDAGEGSAGQILRNPSLYNNADQMLLESRNLIKSIRENPKKYLTIKLRVF